MRVLQPQSSETRKRLHAGERSKLSVTLVECDGSGDVDIGDAVSVGHAKRIVVAEILSDSSEPSSGAGRVAGVDERDMPWLGN